MPVVILVAMTTTGRIRVGIGGWNYEPWRKTFYPAGVSVKDELQYASRKVTAIEINSTFYRLQTAATFAKWRDTTPQDFVFSVKAPRFVTHRRVLADAGPHIKRFLDSGVAELGAKLGPLLWQLDPAHTFDPEDLQRFLALLPAATTTHLPLRHAIEVRHASFSDPRFAELARGSGVAVVFDDDDSYPGLANVTGNFIYARLRRSRATEPTGYPAVALDEWAERARLWSIGSEPRDLPRIEETGVLGRTARDVFIYFINGAKERAPAAAMQLIANLSA